MAWAETAAIGRFVTTTIAEGHVNVPALTWKVALVLPQGANDDISRVSCSTRTIAVIMPNSRASEIIHGRTS